MEVVRPHRVEAEPGFRRGQQEPTLVAVVLRHDEARTIEPVQCAGDLADDVDRRFIDHRMRGVEAQAVDMILVCPVQRVLQDEIPYGRTRWPVEVHRASPRRLMPGIEDASAG